MPRSVTVDDIGAVVVGERTDRDLDLTDGKHRDVGGVAVETADLLTVDVQVQMALAIDMVAVDIAAESVMPSIVIRAL